MHLNEFLLASPMFAGFSPDELESLSRSMRIEHYPDGHVFMCEGEPGDALYLILDGQVAVTRLNRQNRAVDRLHTMAAGELFGLIALVDHGKRTATCTAAGAVTAASLPVTAFALLYDSNAPIAHHFQLMIARQLAHDMRALNRALIDILFGRRARLPRALHAVPHEFASRTADTLACE